MSSNFIVVCALKLYSMVATLSLSGRSLGNCDTVIRAMQSLGIYGDVTRNTTVEPDGSTEQGCRILIANKNATESVHSLWTKLKDLHAVQCAHVRICTEKDGCVYDVLAPSKCPSSP